jgi:hypothetical protein
MIMNDAYDDSLSFSPRGNLRYVGDKDNKKALNKLHRKEQCEKIVHTIYTEVLFHKPKDIKKFIAEELLKPDGAISKLKDSS